MARVGEEGARQCWGAKGRGCFQRGLCLIWPRYFWDPKREQNAAAGAALGARG